MPSQPPSPAPAAGPSSGPRLPFAAGLAAVLLCAVLPFALLLCSCTAAPDAADDNGDAVENFADCKSCHQQPHAMGHELSCGRCHLPPGLRQAPLASHDAVIAHPASLENAPIQCGECHADEVRAVPRSLHATMAGIVNQTRYLWGAQPAADPPFFRAGGASPSGTPPDALEPLPRPPANPLLEPSTHALVDDFLRRRCLRCHIDAAPPPEGENSTALQRGRGCAACHAPHQPRIPDARIPDSRCLACHNNNHTGADYHGLFMRDTDDWFQKAVIQGRQVSAPYGSAQLQLARSVHAERGLWCVDCHDRGEVMALDAASPGQPPEAFALQRSSVSCDGCHGGWGPGLAPAGRLRPSDAGAARILQAASGREHLVPRFRTDHPSHDPAAHGELRCDACHGLWSYQDYGLEAVYWEQDVSQNDTATTGLDVWRYLTRQGDPFVENALLAAMQEGAPLRTPDHIDGDERPGVWIVGYRYRRWAAMPLGRDPAGRVAVLRPRHQYRISAVDHRGVCVLDGALPQRGDGSGRGWAFMPQALHAIGQKGRPCEGCHGNAEAAGLGSDLAALQPPFPMPRAAGAPQQVRDLALATPQPPPYAPGLGAMRLLSMDEAEKLLAPSMEVRKRIFAARRGWLQNTPEVRP